MKTSVLFRNTQEAPARFSVPTVALITAIAIACWQLSFGGAGPQIAGEQPRATEGLSRQWSMAVPAHSGGMEGRGSTELVPSAKMLNLSFGPVGIFVGTSMKVRVVVRYCGALSLLDEWMGAVIRRDGESLDLSKAFARWMNWKLRSVMAKLVPEGL